MSEYREVVDKKRDAMLDTLLECIENNPVPWQKGWVSVFGGLTSSGYPYNAKTGKPYNGINALYLAVIEGRRGYGDARWATYNQIQELGGSVTKGEKGSDIFFWTQYDKATKKPFDRRSVEGMAEEEVKEYLNENVRPVLKNYTVFNAAQCDNFPKAETTKLVEPPKTTGESLESAEKIIRNSAAPVRYDGGNNAFYSTFTDDIHLPKVDAFKTMNDYYATALHEIAHSTGHESRLNRDLSGSFGSEKYAIEELRAELTSVFMQTDLGIELGAAEITNHSAYLKSWLSVVKEDRNVFYKAAADASKATEYIRKNYLDKAEEAVSSEAPKDGQSVSEEAQSIVLTESGTYDVTLYHVESKKNYYFKVVIDNTPPKITITQKGGKVSFTGATKKNVTYYLYKNGELVEDFDGKTVSDKGDYKLVLIDDVGNTQTYEFSVKFTLNTFSILLIAIGSMIAIVIIALAIKGRRVKAA